MHALKTFYINLISVADFFQHLFLLAIRLYWGYAFHLAGCTKFENIGKVTAFFSQIGIPFPELNAYLVGGIECVGGWCLILGLAARLASIPLAATMVIALLTAHHAGAMQIFANQTEFLAQAPVTFLLVTLTIFAFGPGFLSVDYLIQRFVYKKA